MFLFLKAFGTLTIGVCARNQIPEYKLVENKVRMTGCLTLLWWLVNETMIFYFPQYICVCVCMYVCIYTHIYKYMKIIVQWVSPVVHILGCYWRQEFLDASSYDSTCSKKHTKSQGSQQFAEKIMTECECLIKTYYIQ